MQIERDAKKANFSLSLSLFLAFFLLCFLELGKNTQPTYTCTTSRYRKSIPTTTRNSTNALPWPSRLLSRPICADSAMRSHVCLVFLDATFSSLSRGGWEAAWEAARDNKPFKSLAIASATDFSGVTDVGGRQSAMPPGFRITRKRVTRSNSSSSNRFEYQNSLFLTPLFSYGS